jgi:metal-responsive CopG/Arc/MetJ family transcriptional regulator
MKTINTTISIDPQTFTQVERLAKKLHISRSQLFTHAARHMVEMDENLELLKKINAAHEVGGDTAERRRFEKAYIRKTMPEPW